MNGKWVMANRYFHPWVYHDNLVPKVPLDVVYSSCGCHNNNANQPYCYNIQVDVNFIIQGAGFFFQCCTHSLQPYHQQRSALVKL